MQRTKVLAIVVGALVLGFFLVQGIAWVTGQRPSRVGPQWEYKILSTAQALGMTTAPGIAPLMDNTPHAGMLSNKEAQTMQKAFTGEIQQDSERVLNQLGTDGYELCAVTEGYYIFKRRKR